MTTWHPIPTYAGWYDLSDDGRVRSWRLSGSRTGRAEEPSELVPNYSSGSRWPRFVLTKPLPSESKRPSRRGKRRWDLVSLHELQRLCGLDVPEGPRVEPETPEEVDDWYNVPGDYCGLYQIHIDGRVRSLYRWRGGRHACAMDIVKRERPLVLTPHRKRAEPYYRLTRHGQKRVVCYRNIARAFPLGHPIRRALLHEHDLEVVELSAERIKRNAKRAVLADAGPVEGQDEGMTRAQKICASLPPRVVSEIRERWARRNLRRYPTVTVEILADMFLLPKLQVAAIVEGVEEVRA